MGTATLVFGGAYYLASGIYSLYNFNKGLMGGLWIHRAVGFLLGFFLVPWVALAWFIEKVDLSFPMKSGLDPKDEELHNKIYPRDEDLYMKVSFCLIAFIAFNFVAYDWSREQEKLGQRTVTVSDASPIR